MREPDKSICKILNILKTKNKHHKHSVLLPSYQFLEQKRTFLFKDALQS
jgi:hypothetical protein